MLCFQSLQPFHLAMSQLSLTLAQLADRPALSRMLELYQHDLSDIWDQDLDAQGQYGYELEKYWSEPECHPFVFRVGDHYAGFALVNRDVCLAGNDGWMGQFFVLKKYRGRGNGERAAEQLFERFPGRWEVGQMSANLPAQSFWHRVIARYTEGDFVEHQLDDARWQGTLQCFDTHRPRISSP